MNEKFKRGVSAITAVAVFGLTVPSSLFASSDGGILSDALVSINKARSWNDKTSHNYYMGSVYVRFKRPTPPPIIRVSAPQIQAGCNGINIKGMFVSILNLDQLSNMLQNAGASLAWGVAIALIYSLPGVANAFKMINTWAKRIEQILAAACQSGIVLGEYFLNKKGKDGMSVHKWINNHTPNLAADMQKGADWTLDAVGLSGLKGKFDDNGVLNLGGTDKMNKKDTQDALVKYVLAALGNNISLLGSLMTELNTEGGGSLFSKLNTEDADSINPIVAKEINIGGSTKPQDGDNPTISDLIKYSGIGDQDQQKKWKLIFLLYSFISDAVGDIYLRGDVYIQLINLTAYMKNNSEFNQEKAADNILNPEANALTLGKEGHTDLSTKAQQLADIIVKGVKTDSEPTPFVHNIVLAKIQQIGGGKEQTAVVLERHTHKTDLNDILSNWKGTEVAARCAAAQLLHENVNSIDLNTANPIKPTQSSTKKSDANSTTKTSSPVFTTQGTLDCTQVTYFVPDSLEKYGIVYNNTPVEDRGKLRSLLVNYLAYHYTEDMLNTLFTSLSGASIKLPDIKQVSSGSKSTSGAGESNTTNTTTAKKEQTKAMHTSPASKPSDLIKVEDDYVNQINAFLLQVKKDVYAEVKKDSKSVTRDQLDHIFNEQAIQNKERGLRNAMAH